MKNITRAHLYDVCQKNRFILLRYRSDNSQIAVNCRVALLKNLEWAKQDLTETKFISWKACSFHEYISKKVPFI